MLVVILLGWWVPAGVHAGPRGKDLGPARPHRDVLTTQGVVRGYLSPQPPHYSYLGIPYALPPTGKYRFKAPKAPPRWDGIFEANHHVKCPQPSHDGDENCLVINVFAPEQASNCSVLVHVHDGDFKYGWGAYVPPYRLIQQDIVIVTFNYRLGALGFLSLDIPLIRGNAGLKDQVAALYWVYKNIASFGGDPQAVTLYGTGSGAAAIEMLMQSGLTTELFHKVILESGSILSPKSINYYPYSKALENAKYLGYNGTLNAIDLLKFYKNLPIKELLKVDFLPVVENARESLSAFLDKDPKEALEKYSFQDVPILSAYLTYAKYPDKIKLSGTAKTTFPCNIRIDRKETKEYIKNLITDFYAPNAETNYSITYLKQFIYDVETFFPIIKTASIYAQKSTFPVFLMEFDDRPGNDKNVLPDDMTNYVLRTVHKHLYANTGIPQSNELKAQRLAMMWSNFVKFGDPTPLITSLLPTVWQPANQGRKRSISMIPTLKFSDKMRMARPSAERLDFLDRIYISFYKPNNGEVTGTC